LSSIVQSIYNKKGAGMLHRTDEANEGHFVFGVDLDGVCADYSSAFRQVVASEMGVDPASIGKQDHWGFTESGWPIRDEEHYRELHRIGVTKYHMFATAPIIEGASDALWNLSDAGVHIRVITHRLYVPWGHEDVAGDTARWLQQPREDNGKPLIPYRDLCFMSNKTEVGADLYIDDAPHNVTALRRAGADVICFDRLYNQEVPGLRARGWGEVERIVLDRLRDRGIIGDAP
jgi:5'-nucleotidase